MPSDYLETRKDSFPNNDSTVPKKSIGTRIYSFITYLSVFPDNGRVDRIEIKTPICTTTTTKK